MSTAAKRVRPGTSKKLNSSAFRPRSPSNQYSAPRRGPPAAHSSILWGVGEALKARLPPGTRMRRETIEDKKKAIIAEHGPWTAHNLCLGEGVYTIVDGIAGDEIKLRRVIQIISDISARNLTSLRI